MVRVHLESILLSFIESAGEIYVAVTKDSSVTDWASSSNKLQVYNAVNKEYEHIPYFSIDKAHLMYNPHPKIFDVSFDV
jgi:hypothetical protein